MNGYEDATDCVLCAQLATDRDDALCELRAALDVVRSFATDASVLVIAWHQGERVGEALVRVPASRWDDIVELVRCVPTGTGWPT